MSLNAPCRFIFRRRLSLGQVAAIDHSHDTDSACKVNAVGPVNGGLQSKDLETTEFTVDIPPRSLYWQTDDLRYQYEHAVVPICLSSQDGPLEGQSKESKNRIVLLFRDRPSKLGPSREDCS